MTPNIDQLIKHGMLFTTTVCTVASTSVSLGSILTGLFPFKIGMSDTKYEKLNPNIPNFIDFLKTQGYSTHATASNINESLGVTTDFDLKINLNEHTNYLGLFNGLGDKLVQKLSGNMKEPWFFYIHIYDLHQPILVPNKFNEKKYGITQYDKMISAIDYWIGEILHLIDTNKTLIVLTADHGDYVRSITREGKEINLESSKFEKSLWKMGNRIPMSLYSPKQKAAKILQLLRSNTRKMKIKNLNLSIYEKRILETTRMDPSNHLYDDVLIVPLILYGKCVNQNRIINQQVRSIDIFPTIMDLIDLEFKQKTDGRSLTQIIKGEYMEELPAYIESMPAIKENNEKFVGLRTSEYKYIRSKTAQQRMLYDLKQDPHEENNIIDKYPEIANKMERILNTMLEEQQKNDNTLNMEQREKVERELKKLGYL